MQVKVYIWITGNGPISVCVFLLISPTYSRSSSPIITWDYITVLYKTRYSHRSHISGGFALYCRQTHIKRPHTQRPGFQRQTDSQIQWMALVAQQVMTACCNLERSPLKTEAVSHSADRYPALTLMPSDHKACLYMQFWEQKQFR